MTTPNNAQNREPTESPLQLAKRLGLLSLRHKNGYETITYDGLLDLACLGYWRRRVEASRRAAA